MAYKVTISGVSTKNPRGFCIDWPNGSSTCTFLHAISDFIVQSANGREVLRAGECIIYDHYMTRYLEELPGGDQVINNWVHFECDDLAETLKRLHIPLNVPFYLSEPYAVISIISHIFEEQATVDPKSTFFTTSDEAFAHGASQMPQMELAPRPHSDEIVSAYMDILFMLVSRRVCPRRSSYSPEDEQRRHDFNACRNELYLHPEQNWNVADMAASMLMSRNRFTMLYQDFLGITPKHDIMLARVQRAKLLFHLNQSLRDIALSSGFQNEYYFSRVFRNVTGKTPGEYRRSIETSVSERASKA